MIEVLESETYTMPLLLTVISFKPEAPSNGIFFSILPFFISITTTSLISATYNLLPNLPSPFGAFKPVIHLPSKSFPFTDNLPTPPTPSASQPPPSIKETYKIFPSKSTDSGTGIIESVSQIFSSLCCAVTAIDVNAKIAERRYFIKKCFKQYKNNYADNYNSLKII